MLLKIGSQGNLVLTMQKLLKSLNFEVSCDGVFGAKTEKVVKLAQEDLLLQVDGLVGNKTWNKLIEASKFVTQNYKEKTVWLNPKDLQGALVKATSSSLSKKFQNFINGTYYWYKTGIGNCIIGWFYSNGKQINYSNFKRNRGTFLVKKDGTVIARRMNDDELMAMRDDLWFVVQGFDAININFKTEGLDVDEVGRKCIRPVLGYNPKTNKVLIAMFNGNYNDAKSVLKKYGCIGIGLDGGGSSNMFVDGKYVYKTSRTLNNIVYW